MQSSRVRGRKGSVLLLALFFLFVLFLLALAFFKLIPAEYQSARKMSYELNGFYAASAGVDAALVRIESELAANSRPSTLNLSGQLDSGWTYSTTATLLNAPLTTYRVVSQGLDERGKLRRVIKAVVQERQISDFALFTEGRLEWNMDNVVTGPAYAGEDLRFWAAQNRWAEDFTTFTDFVVSAQPEGASNVDWKGNAGAPSSDTEWDEATSQGKDGIIYGYSGLRVPSVLDPSSALGMTPPNNLANGVYVPTASGSSTPAAGIYIQGDVQRMTLGGTVDADNNPLTTTIELIVPTGYQGPNAMLVQPGVTAHRRGSRWLQVTVDGDPHLLGEPGQLLASRGGNGNGNGNGNGSTTGSTTTGGSSTGGNGNGNGSTTGGSTTGGSTTGGNGNGGGSTGGSTTGGNGSGGNGGGNNSATDTWTIIVDRTAQTTTIQKNGVNVETRAGLPANDLVYVNGDLGTTQGQNTITDGLSGLNVGRLTLFATGEIKVKDSITRPDVSPLPRPTNDSYANPDYLAYLKSKIPTTTKHGLVVFGEQTITFNAEWSSFKILDLYGLFVSRDKVEVTGEQGNTSGEINMIGSIAEVTALSKDQWVNANSGGGNDDWIISAIKDPNWAFRPAPFLPGTGRMRVRTFVEEAVAL